MDTPLAAAIHKENVHITGGEKATDKLKTFKTAGKKRKASADLRSTYVPVAGASKDVDLKQKYAMKGNKIKKNQVTQGKRHAALANLTTEKPNHILTDKEIRQWSKYGIPKAFREDDESEFFMMRKESLLREEHLAAAADCTTKKPNLLLTYEEILTHEEILTDEEIRSCYERPNHILTDEEIKKIRKSIEDAENDESESCMRIESLWRETISKLKPPSLSDEEGCKTDGSDFDCFKFVPGPCYTPEELDDPFDEFEVMLEKLLYPELKLDDD